MPRRFINTRGGELGLAAAAAVREIGGEVLVIDESAVLHAVLRGSSSLEAVFVVDLML